MPAENLKYCDIMKYLLTATKELFGHTCLYMMMTYAECGTWKSLPLSSLNLCHDETSHAEILFNKTTIIITDRKLSHKKSMNELVISILFNGNYSRPMWPLTLTLSSRDMDFYPVNFYLANYFQTDRGRCIRAHYAWAQVGTIIAPITSKFSLMYQPFLWQSQQVET